MAASEDCFDKSNFNGTLSRIDTQNAGHSEAYPTPIRVYFHHAFMPGITIRAAGFPACGPIAATSCPMVCRSLHRKAARGRIPASRSPEDALAGHGRMFPTECLPANVLAPEFFSI
jgi:hypothetical protein